MLLVVEMGHSDPALGFGPSYVLDVLAG